MAGTVAVAVNPTSYVSLATTGPMFISVTTSAVEIVAATSQPAAATVGHPVSPEFIEPFFFSLAEQVWAISRQGAQNVIVTT